jgi:hypothetical protein
MAKIPEFPNETNSNPVVAIDLQTKAGVVLRFAMPDVQQSRVMVAMGRLLADLDVPLDLSLPDPLAIPQSLRPVSPDAS